MTKLVSTICILIMAGSLAASTGFIEGVIKVVEGGLVIEGVNHYGHKGAGEPEKADHQIPGRGTPVYILDGHITTREAALKVGRRCFVFWNRHTQQMVVVRSKPDEHLAEIPPGPVPAGDYVNTAQGVIKSAAEDALVFTVKNGDAEEEKTVPLRKGKTGFILDNRYGSKFEDVCVVGRHAVAFCYRGREYPNFVVSCSIAE